MYCLYWLDYFLLAFTGGKDGDEGSESSQSSKANSPEVFEYEVTDRRASKTIAFALSPPVGIVFEPITHPILEDDFVSGETRQVTFGNGEVETGIVNDKD